MESKGPPNRGVGGTGLQIGALHAQQHAEALVVRKGTFASGRSGSTDRVRISDGFHVCHQIGDMI